MINYNLRINKIYKNIFFIENEKVKIEKLKDISKINILVELTNNMYENKIPVDTFILNVNNEYFTKKNNEYIILIKINDNDEFIDLNEIIKYSKIINNLESYSVIEKYKKEIDQFEDNINNYELNIEEIRKTANYYIGMAENAISLLSDYKYNTNELGCNVNIYKFNKKEINNPLNYIKINKYYNITNYLKTKFLKNIFDYEEIEKVLKEIKTEEEEAIFFSYMMFPNYYFDIFNNEIDEKKIEFLIKNHKKYIEILKYIKKNAKKCKKIKLFVWIN